MSANLVGLDVPPAEAEEAGLHGPDGHADLAVLARAPIAVQLVRKSTLSLNGSLLSTNGATEISAHGRLAPELEHRIVAIDYVPPNGHRITHLVRTRDHGDFDDHLARQTAHGQRFAVESLGGGQGWRCHAVGLASRVA